MTHAPVESGVPPKRLSISLPKRGRSPAGDPLHEDIIESDAVAAQVVRLTGYSGNADVEGLLDVVFPLFRGKRGLAAARVFLNHGGHSARAGLRTHIMKRSPLLSPQGE